MKSGLCPLFIYDIQLLTEYKNPMEKKLSIEDRVEACIKPIFAGSPYEIYDIEFVKEAGEYYLRIFIDKEGGVDLDDCEAVTDMINDPLDAVDPIAGGYYLEVSSPGIERKLKTADHFLKAIGEKIHVKAFAPINGKKEVTGILKSFTNEEAVVEAEGECFVFPLSKIAKANLSVF